MPSGLIESAANSVKPEDRVFYGVTAATVINNEDCSGQNRVQISISWLPGYEPWARVATPMAGKGRGAFFIPQKDDEVLVAFTQGDVMEPYIIGSLWNEQDPAPTKNPKDATNKRIIRTPRGHELEFDDANESITVTSITSQRIVIEPKKIRIKISGNAATLTLDEDGNISIEAARSIRLKAPDITIDASKKVAIKSSGHTTIAGGDSCDINAGVVKIN